jgi:hypothetical protein
MEFSWLISFGLVAFASLSAAIISYTCLKRSEQQRELVQKQLTKVMDELQAYKNTSIGLGKKVHSIEMELADTVEKQQDLEFQDPNSLPYTQASRLIQMGADADDLVSSCGLSTAEAELLMLVNRQPMGAVSH